MIKKSVLLIVMLAAATSAFSQYKLYHSENGLEIFGKWKHEKPFGKGKYVLCLKVKNTNDEMVQTSFSIEYYEGPLMTESFDAGPLCIKANKKVKGRAGNLCFVSSKFSKTQLFDETFHWKVDDLKVEKGNCTESNE